MKNSIIFIGALLLIVLGYIIGTFSQNSSIEDNSGYINLTSKSTTNSQYLKSSTNVYWANVSEADPSTLTIFKGNLEPSIYDNSLIYAYAADKDNLYYMGERILEGNVDVESFVPIENGKYMHYYGKDKNNVYYESYQILDSDPNTFKVLWTIPMEGCSKSHYAKDKNNVYFKMSKVIGADLNTFEALYDDYGRDKNNVYLKGVLQEKINPQDFVAPMCEYGFLQTDIDRIFFT